MFGRIEKFFADRKGAFAIQFALMVVPLTVCTGLAIDGGRAFLARYELEEALDAAALAVGSTVDDNADLDAIAAAWVAKNFKTAHTGNIDLDLDVDGDVITLGGTVNINTFFMPLMGRDTVTVSATSQARRGGGNVEVALALDITQSMSGSKINALKDAAKDLVAEVVNDQQTPFFSRVAIAPWGTNLHAATKVGSTITPFPATLRGPATGTTPITGAHWRNGAGHNISGGTWKNGAQIASVTANWHTGTTPFSVSIVTTASSKVKITVTGTPTLSNDDVIGLYIPSSGSPSPAAGNYGSYKDRAYKLKSRSPASGGASVTFELQDIDGNWISAGSGTNGTNWRGYKCLNIRCQMRLSATNTLANGDYVHLTGFTTDYTSLNNTFGSPWQVTSTPTATTSSAVFINVVGPTLATANANAADGTAGVIQKCYTSTCQYAITATAHGFSNADRVTILNTTTSGGGATDIDNTSSTIAWTIANVTTNTFTLPGLGNSYATWSTGGTASKCFNTNCQVKITSTSHGLAANEYVQIAAVGGITGVNNTAVQVSSIVNTNEFYLTGWGPGLTNGTANYTANTGTSQCLRTGCQIYRFLDAGGSTAQIRAITNCVTERIGTNATTDVAPASGLPATWLGRDYQGNGTLVGCEAGNYLTPLTHDKDKLEDAIDDLHVSGSTSGQIGTAWGWYMLSEHWDGFFAGADHQPVPKTTPLLSRVLVLMTDGAFNTAHCNGVTTEAYAYSSVANSDKIDSSVCTASTAPFTQAQAICTAIKADDILVYTVGFQVGSEPGAEDFLRACATDTNKAYIAANATQLQDAFKAIGKEIAKLRLSE